MPWESGAMGFAKLLTLGISRTIIEVTVTKNSVEEL